MRTSLLQIVSVKVTSSSFLDKDVAEGAVSKAVEVVLIPPHPVFD